MVAESLGIPGQMVPKGWVESSTSTIEEAGFGHRVPAGRHRSSVGSGRHRFGSMGARWCSDMRAPVSAVSGSPWRPGRRWCPPLEADVIGVEVRGLPGRFTPNRGELEWVEAGHVVTLRSSTLGLEELLAVATEMDSPLSRGPLLGLGIGVVAGALAAGFLAPARASHRAARRWRSGGPRHDASHGAGPSATGVGRCSLGVDTGTAPQGNRYRRRRTPRCDWRRLRQPRPPVGDRDRVGQGGGGRHRSVGLRVPTGGNRSSAPSNIAVSCPKRSALFWTDCAAAERGSGRHLRRSAGSARAAGCGCPMATG